MTGVRKKSNKAEDRLTMKQRKFVDALTDQRKPTFLSTAKAAKEAYPEAKNARCVGYDTLQKPHVQTVLRDRLETDKVNDMIERGVLKRLEDPASRHWQPTADYVSKVKGDFAAEKHEVYAMKGEDRDRKYDDIIKLVRGGKVE